MINKDPGIYKCVFSGNHLFTSGAKFDSGIGWPRFWGALKRENIIEEIDNSLVMRHTEIIRGTCGAHLGHVFGDGPEPTGLR